MRADLVVEPVCECRAADVETLLERHESFWHLAAIGVGDAEHDRFLDRGMLVEMRLDHARIDFEPADRDHVLQPVDDAEIAARLDHSDVRSEEHTSELQSLMRISYAVFCLQKKNTTNYET